MSLSLVSPSRLAARRDRNVRRDALLAVASVFYIGTLAWLQLGGCSGLPIFDKSRRSVPPERSRPLQVSALEGELLLRGVDLLDHAPLAHQLRRWSGESAKRKRRPNRQRGDGCCED